MTESSSCSPSTSANISGYPSESRSIRLCLFFARIGLDDGKKNGEERFKEEDEDNNLFLALSALPFNRFQWWLKKRDDVVDGDDDDYFTKMA